MFKNSRRIFYLPTPAHAKKYKLVSLGLPLRIGEFFSPRAYIFEDTFNFQFHMGPSLCHVSLRGCENLKTRLLSLTLLLANPCSWEVPVHTL